MGSSPATSSCSGSPTARATGWYESEAYQEILPLRTRNARGWAVIVDGVSADHRATGVLTPAA